MEIHFAWPEYSSLLLLKHRVASIKCFSSLHGVCIRSIAEIGVFQGEASKLFRLVFPGASIFLIDPWKPDSSYLTPEAAPISYNAKDYEDAYSLVQSQFQNDPNTIIFRQTSAKAAELVPDGLDLVFIDGDHSYESVKQDIALWEPKVRPGGIIAGHDYCYQHFPQVIKAVDECFPKNLWVGPDVTWCFLKPSDGSILEREDRLSK
jgi:hypothetical protein